MIDNRAFFTNLVSGGVKYEDEIVDYVLWYEILPFNENIALQSSSTETVRNVSKEMYFRNWTFVQASDLAGIKIFKMEEDEQQFYVSNTKHYVPWWLKTEGLPPDNEFLPNEKCSNINPKQQLNNKSLLASDIVMPNSRLERNINNSSSSISNSSKSSAITLTSSSSNESSLDSDTSKTNRGSVLQEIVVLDCEKCIQKDFNNNEPSVANDVTNLHGNTKELQEPNPMLRLNAIVHSNQNSERVSTSFESRESGSDNYSFSSEDASELSKTGSYTDSVSHLDITTKADICDNPDIETFDSMIEKLHMIKEYIEIAINYEVYLKEKEKEKDQLNILFEDMVLKTAEEKGKLDEKGVATGRYVNMFKRLSIKSQNICEEARMSRELYNKQAKSFNETIKRTPNIQIPPEVRNAMKGILKIKTVIVNSHKVSKFPIYETSKDVQSSSLYVDLIENFSIENNE